MIRFFKKYIIGSSLILCFLHIEVSALTPCIDVTDAPNSSTGTEETIEATYNGYLRVTRVEAWFSLHAGDDEILN